MTSVDRAIALSAILTAVVRPSLPLAPGYNVNATTIASGKSYLCGLFSSFASASFSSKTTYPKSSEDASKIMLSLLMKSPACIEFDDMDGNWKPYSIIKTAFTAETVTERMLGVNKTVEVSTRALILGSGNNVFPERDLVRRVFTINLDPQMETPATRKYAGDPIADVCADRGEYVMAVINIIESFKKSDVPCDGIISIASYGGEWTEYCRKPLVWLGIDDPANALVEQIARDPDKEALGNLLSIWFDCFGSQPTTVRTALDGEKPKNYEIAFGKSDEDLEEAIREFPVVDNRGNINRGKLGYMLKRNQGKIVGGLKFLKCENRERNHWKVVKVDSGSS